ncbi:MAG TPA: hypothetical protein VM223_19800 [Planctomycetota bacterium]|nr:hypothetical protein [Planctomycetota bacterium]
MIKVAAFDVDSNRQAAARKAENFTIVRTPPWSQLVVCGKNSSIPIYRFWRKIQAPKFREEGNRMRRRRGRRGNRMGRMRRMKRGLTGMNGMDGMRKERVNRMGRMKRMKRVKKRGNRMDRMKRIKRGLTGMNGMDGMRKKRGNRMDRIERMKREKSRKKRNREQGTKNKEGRRNENRLMREFPESAGLMSLIGRPCSL